MTGYEIRPDHAQPGPDAAGCALAWREWDGEWVVYDGQSGSTHLLDDTAGAMLAALCAVPSRSLGLDALFEQVFGADEVPSDSELHHVRQVLADLERIGLIRQCPA